MKRSTSICMLAVGAALFSISGYAQEAQEKLTLEQRVEQLEKQLEENQATLEGLVESAEAGTAELDAISQYLQQQAAAANSMVATLASSESQGFVAGINFPSRETLLSGWRKQLATAQKGVPGVKAPVEEEDPRSSRGRGRR